MHAALLRKQPDKKSNRAQAGFASSLLSAQDTGQQIHSDAQDFEKSSLTGAVEFCKKGKIKAIKKKTTKKIKT